MKVRLDQTTLVPGDERICITGSISGDPFEACLDMSVVESYGKLLGNAHSHSARFGNRNPRLNPKTHKPCEGMVWAKEHAMRRTIPGQDR